MEDSFAGVRIARPGDEENLFELMVLAQSENGQFPMNSQKVKEFISNATQSKGGIIGVIEGKDRIEASVGMVIQQYWYTDTWSLGERWNFVHPEHRRSTHAKRLIEFAKWCADKLKIDLEMGIITNERTEAKIRLYKRQLPCVGAYFMYKV